MVAVYCIPYIFLPYKLGRVAKFNIENLSKHKLNQKLVDYIHLKGTLMLKGITTVPNSYSDQQLGTWLDWRFCYKEYETTKNKPKSNDRINLNDLIRMLRPLECLGNLICLLLTANIFTFCYGILKGNTLHLLGVSKDIELKFEDSFTLETIFPLSWFFLASLKECEEKSIGDLVFLTFTLGVNSHQ